MNIKTFDIVLLFVLSIVMSMLIGYNIIFMIDKKLSSVNINIPPVNVPKSEIVVNVGPTAMGSYGFKTDEKLIRFNNGKIMNNNKTVAKRFM